MELIKRIYRRIKEFRKTNSKIFNARKELKHKNRINLGASHVPFDSQWFSCDIDILDITKKENWKYLLGKRKISNLFAEHVWEHLTDEDTISANSNCYEFLQKGGKLRLAVPDGYHPDASYIDYVKPGGHGAGADDHKILYTYKSMSERLEKIGFTVVLLEYWDENGKFHSKSWSEEDGKVRRSQYNDNRNSSGVLKYTSLIVDAIK